MNELEYFVDLRPSVGLPSSVVAGVVVEFVVVVGDVTEEVLVELLVGDVNIGSSGALRGEFSRGGVKKGKEPPFFPKTEGYSRGDLILIESSL
jgi:hypothetical protein